MQTPNIALDKQKTKGFFFRENSHDRHMLDICTTLKNGRTLVWGVVNSDFLQEIEIKSVHPSVWAGLPEDEKRVTAICVTINLEDFELD